jgi:zinc finger protein 830
MADVRRLLQAERRQREGSKQKQAGTTRAGKRPYSETADGPSKRTKTTSVEARSLPAGFFDNGPETGDGAGERTRADDAPMDEASHSSLPADFFEAKSSDQPAEVDEDEWAAFQAEVVNVPSTAAITTSTVVITAAPTMNNPDAENDGSDQEKMDDYGKGEEEDAKQKLLDEFEEMESLEQRVIRLKQRREALKSNHLVTAAARMEIVVEDHGRPVEFDEDEDEDVDEDEDDDDFFRARGS